MRTAPSSPAAPPPALPSIPGADIVVAPFLHAGEARDAVVALKYRGDRRALTWLARSMVGLVDPVLVPGSVVTWAPTTARRRRERGFDQAELLARHVAARLGLSCRPMLRRHRGPHQTGHGRAERLGGPSFRAADVADSVVLVDDVITTGATVTAAARALALVGTRRIVVASATIAATTPII